MKTALVAMIAIALSGAAPVSAAAPAKATTAAAARTGYAPVRGLKIYYEIHGTGAPLILLHGGFGASDMFRPFIPQLAAKRQVIALDLQGHGRTADVDRPLRAEAMADDVAAVAQHLGITRTDVMGYSMGGGVALQTAIRHPALVRKLVVVSSTFRRDGWHPEILAAMSQMGPQAAEMMKKTPMYQLYARVAPRPQDWAVLMAKVGEAVKQDYDWSKAVAALPMPTLLAFGDADSVRPAHVVEFFGLLGGGKRDGGWDGSGMSRARLAILPGTTHYTIFASPALAAAVGPFLDEAEARASKDGTKDLIVTRRFAAPVDAVWKAWTSSDQVKRWWGPNGFSCPVAKMDVREGGTSLVAMRSPDGKVMTNSWTYSKVVPRERLEFVLDWADPNGKKIDPAALGLPPDMPRNVRHVITFKSLGPNDTEMTITEFGYTSDQHFNLSKQGLEQSLDKMAASFAKS